MLSSSTMYLQDSLQSCHLAIVWILARKENTFAFSLQSPTALAVCLFREKKQRRGDMSVIDRNYFQLLDSRQRVESFNKHQPENYVSVRINKVYVKATSGELLKDSAQQERIVCTGLHS